MKPKRRLFLAALLAVCLLCACAGETEVSPDLEFPGIPWNASHEEVCAALGLDPADHPLTEEGGYYVMSIEGLEAFGQPSVDSHFYFAKYYPPTSDHLGFTQAQIFYPEDCDKDAVFSALTETYGPEAQEYTQYDVFTGEPYTYTKQEGYSRWYSQRVLTDVMADLPEDAAQVLLDLYTTGLSEEDAGNLAATQPAANVSWAEDYYKTMLPSLEYLAEENGRVACLSIEGSLAVRGLQMLSAIQ